MPMDAAERRQAAEHLLRNVVNLQQDSHLENALNHAGAMDIDMMLALSEDDIRTLQWNQPTNNGRDRLRNLTTPEKAVGIQLTYFLRFMSTRTAEPFEELDHVTRLTHTRYRKYILTEHLPFMRELDANATVSANSMVTATSTTSTTPSEQFRRQIKIDPSRFPILRRDSEFDDWNRETVLLCHAYGLENVLEIDPKYTPVGTEAITLFNLQQAFMMTVWAKTLQTETGRAAVREYASTQNAQSAYAKVLKKAKTSNAALHTLNAIYSEVTGMKLSDRYTGSYEDYILKWADLIRKHDELCASAGDRFTEGTKKRQLQAMISDSPLHHATQLMNIKAAGSTGHTLSYDDYFQLIIGIAQEADTSCRDKIRPRGSRDVQMHQTSEDPSISHLKTRPAPSEPPRWVTDGYCSWLPWLDVSKRGGKERQCR